MRNCYRDDANRGGCWLEWDMDRNRECFSTVISVKCNFSRFFAMIFYVQLDVDVECLL